MSSGLRAATLLRWQLSAPSRAAGRPLLSHMSTATTASTATARELATAMDSVPSRDERRRRWQRHLHQQRVHSSIWPPSNTCPSCHARRLSTHASTQSPTGSHPLRRPRSNLADAQSPIKTSLPQRLPQQQQKQYSHQQRRQAHSQQEELVRDDLDQPCKGQRLTLPESVVASYHHYLASHRLKDDSPSRDESAAQKRPSPLRRPRPLRLGDGLYSNSADVLRAAGIDLERCDFNHAESVLRPILTLPADTVQEIVRFFSEPCFGTPGRWLDHLLAKHPDALASFNIELAYRNLRFAEDIGLAIFPDLVHDAPQRILAQQDLKEFFDAFEELGASYETTKVLLQPPGSRGLFGYTRSPRHFVDRLAALNKYFGHYMVEPILQQKPELILLSLQSLVAKLTVLSIAGVYQHAMRNPSSPVLRGMLTLLCTGVKGFIARTGMKHNDYQHILATSRRLMKGSHPDVQTVIDRLDSLPSFKNPVPSNGKTSST